MPKNENNTVTMELRKSKETKGTVVFKQITATDERAHTFYILKDLYKRLGEPSQIVMTLEVD